MKMKNLRPKHDFKQAAAKLRSQFADPSNATHTLTEGTRVFTPDGSVTAVFLPNVFPVDLQLRAYELLKDVNHRINNRPGALGTVSLPQYRKEDGSPSPRRGVHKIVLDVSPARQGILGWDRSGHKTHLTRQHPEMLIGNRALIESADRLYAKHLPDSYAEQQAVLEKASCKLWNTAFTTVYVARKL